MDLDIYIEYAELTKWCEEFKNLSSDCVTSLDSLKTEIESIPSVFNAVPAGESCNTYGEILEIANKYHKEMENFSEFLNVIVKEYLEFEANAGG